MPCAQNLASLLMRTLSRNNTLYNSLPKITTTTANSAMSRRNHRYQLLFIHIAHPSDLSEDSTNDKKPNTFHHCLSSILSLMLPTASILMSMKISIIKKCVRHWRDSHSLRFRSNYWFNGLVNYHKHTSHIADFLTSLNEPFSISKKCPRSCILRRDPKLTVIA